MSDVAWIALGGFLLSLGIAVVGVTLGVRRISDAVSDRLDAKIAELTRAQTQMELAYERKLSQSDAGLRRAITDVQFFIRDNFVGLEIFHKMIDMASANNENQFRTLNESINRINDKLDTIQRERA